MSSKTVSDKMNDKKYLTHETVPQSSNKVVKRGKIGMPNKQIYDRHLSGHGTGTSIKSGGVKLVLWLIFICFLFQLNDDKT